MVFTFSRSDWEKVYLGELFVMLRILMFRKQWENIQINLTFMTVVFDYLLDVDTLSEVNKIDWDTQTT